MPIEPLITLAFGLIFGSFVTCASYRLPLGEDVVKKPSYCPKCRAKLGFRDLWPVFSWLFSGGKCRHCGAKISVRYPLIEITTATMFLLIYSRYGISHAAAVFMLMAVALLVMIVADLEHTIIPDEVHIALLPLGLFYHYLAATPWESVSGGFLIGGGLGLLLHYGYGRLRKKDVLGFGDVKFLAVAGLWLTPLSMPAFLFYSGALGVASGLLWRARGKGPVFPFGPALATALFLCVAYPESVQLFWTAGGLVRP